MMENTIKAGIYNEAVSKLAHDCDTFMMDMVKMTFGGLDSLSDIGELDEDVRVFINKSLKMWNDMMKLVDLQAQLISENSKTLDAIYDKLEKIEKKRGEK